MINYIIVNIFIKVDCLNNILSSIFICFFSSKVSEICERICVTRFKYEVVTKKVIYDVVIRIEKVDQW